MFCKNHVELVLPKLSATNVDDDEIIVEWVKFGEKNVESRESGETVTRLNLVFIGKLYLKQKIIQYF